MPDFNFQTTIEELSRSIPHEPGETHQAWNRRVLGMARLLEARARESEEPPVPVTERRGRYSNKEWESMSEESKQAVRDAVRQRREVRDEYGPIWEDETREQPVLSIKEELMNSANKRLRRIANR